MRTTPPVVSLVLVAGLLASACAGRKAAWEGAPPPADTSKGAEGAQAASGKCYEPAGDLDEATAKQVADAIARGDAAWAERTSPDAIRKAIAAWEEAAKIQTGNVDLLVKLTRAHYFLADGYLRDDAKAYLATMDKGVSWGECAIAASSPEFAKKLEAGAKLHEAVAVVPKEGVPAMYWYASALGKWAKKKGFAVLLGQKDNVKATMDRCLALDPEYYYAGPYRYFGAYYAVAPSFAGGDLNKSREFFEKSLSIEPRYLGTKVLWAQELSVKLQDEDEFERLLNEVLAAPDDIIPELVPETLVEKQKAKELLAQKDELF
ncbi:MAG: hypothetical protein D6705_10340 [Deltaproteobacteria bacterium]|nr:MAG: hypothetical protein D6705_10340 [Deltaproteobacteria bacterium]